MERLAAREKDGGIASQVYQEETPSFPIRVFGIEIVEGRLSAEELRQRESCSKWRRQPLQVPGTARLTCGAFSMVKSP